MMGRRELSNEKMCSGFLPAGGAVLHCILGILALQCQEDNHDSKPWKKWSRLRAEPSESGFR